MTTFVIDSVGRLTPAWLDAVLRRARVLGSGGVESFEVARRDEAWSTTARLRVRYTAGSTGERPEALFLKICTSNELGPSEVHYYRRDYLDAVDVPLLRCFDASHDRAARAYHLLLEDVSSTHVDAKELPVTEALVEALAEGTAALHAHRWTDRQLDAIDASRVGELELDRYFAHVGRGLEPLLEIGAEVLDARGRALLHDVFARQPAAMLERARRPGTCLVHGDINPGNILAPRSGAGRLYLIDRQPFDWSLQVWLGVSDLAYLTCCFWPVEARRSFESLLVRCYVDALARRGVEDYGVERAWSDYRLCAVQALCVAVQWCIEEADRQRMRWLWMVQLDRAFSAFRDLRCDELWRR